MHSRETSADSTSRKGCRKKASLSDAKSWERCRPATSRSISIWSASPIRTPGKIWLISSETLAKLPELYEQVEARQVESKLPAFLVKHQFGGMPLWQWAALLLALPIAAGLGWLVLVLLEAPRALVGAKARTGRGSELALGFGTSMAAGGHAHPPGMRCLFAHGRYCRAITTSRSPRLLSSSALRGWSGAACAGRCSAFVLALWPVGMPALARSMLLGERILKFAIFVIGVLAVLGNLGFNMSTALAGLGHWRAGHRIRRAEDD